MMVGVLCLYREEIAMNKDVLKDVFLHGETHAAMPIDCKEPVLSYDSSSLYDAKMYEVCIRIGSYHTYVLTCEDFSKIYRAGRSIVKCCKRNRFKARFIVRDAVTYEDVVWFYSRQSVSGEWVACQSSVGKYHKHIEF